MSTSPNRFWISALIIAWSFDLLFWKKAPGISFAIFVLLCLAGGLYLAWRERVRMAPVNLVLLALILVFAALTFLRAEMMTLFLSTLASIALLAILAYSFIAGTWWRFSVSDYATGLMRLVLNTLAGPIRLWQAGPSHAAGADAARPHAPRGWAVVRGILLALPILAVFAALLASADPVFSKRLEEVLKFLRIENLPEYIFRLAYILVGAFLLVGVFVYALFSSREHKLIGLEKPWMPRFLGFTEAAIILASVDLLFATFVAIQFRYLFGGQANITLEGFTYSEYARRGFGELVAVAVLSQLLFLGLTSLTRRGERREQRLFSIFGAGLVLLVIVILVSAYLRLQLYESAYGFSRLRTYTHVFIIWLGAWLAALLALDLTQRLRAFALVTLAALLGFALSLAVLNVDGFIVRQNVARALAGQALDTGYLASLSEDSVPALIDLHHRLQGEVKAEVGGVLACRAAIEGHDQRVRAWPSFTVPLWRAQQLMKAEAPALAAYTTVERDGLFYVQVNGSERTCYAPYID
jgi:Domain of unknown function (DUF4153)